ncbi:MAG: universal stress protein [Methanomicrobiales archaeon]|nr:universal stress protein [Methanomicrobiales archaeon]
MFSRLLFPVELTGNTEKMFCALQELVTAGVKEITLLHILGRQEAERDPGMVSYAEGVLSDWRVRLERVGVPRVISMVTKGIPWVEIVEESRRKDYSVILMGSRGKGMLQQMFLGNETENVLHYGTRPLLIIRLHIVEAIDERSCALARERLFQHVLYATDFSEDAKKCIPYLESMARASPERVTIVHIQDLRSLGYATEAQMAAFNLRDTERLEGLKRQFNALGCRHVNTILRTGNAITELLRIIHEEGVTLLVMGAKGRTNVPAMTLGGVSETLIRRADCHVLVVR